ncbi:MAG: xseB [Planctomycetaceae bacterium]|nr:xseB [Planctomycetaceae bacterium]
MSTSSEPSPPLSFEEAVLSLQKIVADLEGGTITLDESLRRFEEGIGLLRQCYQFLERAEQRIEQLVSLDAQGNITLVPFDATATVDKQAKPAARAPSKRSPKAKEPEVSLPAVEKTPDEDDGLDIPDKLLF